MEPCLHCKHLKPITGGCRAFPQDIPYEFATGAKKHYKVVPGQVGRFVFEEGEPPDEIKEALKIM